MSTLVAHASAQTRASRVLAFVGGFHLWMAFSISTLLIISLAGCALTVIELPGLGPWAIYLLVISAMLLPLPAYWYEKGRADLLDSALTLLWALLVRLIVPILVQGAARLRMPLQDSFFGRADEHLGVSVPAIMAWTAHHWLGSVLNRSYAWVVILLPLAVLLPVLAGRLKYAKEFLVANLISFAIGLPLFALLPAIGPWRYYHFLPTQSQTESCELPLLAMRLTGTYVLGSQEVGVVCFPSFHVVWDILFAAALWGFRWLRIPVALVAAMVILSTMTTGWHYFADVLGGVLLAIISILSAKRLTQPTQTIRRQPSGRRPVGLFLTTLFNRAKSGEQQPGAARGQILSQLSDLPGRQLIIVRYRPDHALLAPDLADSDADIDHIRIIWARDMGPAENEELIRYYGARGAWLLDADVIPPKFAPYPSRCDGQLVVAAAQKMGNSAWRKAGTNNAE